MMNVTYEPFMPSVIKLNVIMLNVTYEPFMPSVIMLNVVVPFNNDRNKFARFFINSKPSDLSLVY
jgi:hypothetical protein